MNTRDADITVRPVYSHEKTNETLQHNLVAVHSVHNVCNQIEEGSCVGIMFWTLCTYNFHQAVNYQYFQQVLVLLPAAFFKAKLVSLL